ncbi:TPA: morphogenetic protein [Klebsiella pneumoniae]|nr:morphogenetic protein [Klebsiella pneumoniae]EKU2993647.1 morphogenetic protein [Klebsiella pneumoniae]EKX6828595.1 morphogenetic protein [Klebsiella pneumoniae]MDJ1055409.1 morphogenetic protein [Klebsiella pneumoniae]MDV1422929.1 morphogenetic protein [Klebsiella pneumoniae]MDV1428522.1 morphogenetic protein [Klebsiella pneumoniae]
MTKITERGMIFNGEMVRAILDGRKTQTRRIMAPQPADDIERGIFPNPEAIGWKSSLRHKHGSTTAHFCPYGKPGDRIWVRETFQGPLFDYDLMDSYCKDSTPFEKPEFCVYKADGVPAPEFYDADDELHCCWRPSIHMPRWASRILLEITDVRVERLNAISEEDAEAEGIDMEALYDSQDCYDCIADHNMTGRPTVTGAFKYLWESIYGEESWKANGWVWVISFKRVEGGAA